MLYALHTRQLNLTKPQMIETVAFAFSIMAVIGGVSSTLSFGLISGEPLDIEPNDVRSWPCRERRRTRRHGLGLVHTVHIHYVYRSLYGRVGVVHAVSDRQVRLFWRCEFSPTQSPVLAQGSTTSRQSSHLSGTPRWRAGSLAGPMSRVR